jgi:hypothetical protein
VPSCDQKCHRADTQTLINFAIPNKTTKAALNSELFQQMNLDAIKSHFKLFKAFEHFKLPNELYLIFHLTLSKHVIR